MAKRRSATAGRTELQREVDKNRQLLDDLRAKVKDLKSELSWYDSFSKSEWDRDRRHALRRLTEVSDELQSREADWDAVSKRLGRLEQASRMGWSPQRWFSAERIRSARERDRTLDESVELGEMVVALTDKQELAQHAVDEMDRELKTYKSFNRATAAKKLKSLQDRLAAARAEDRKLRARVEKFDKVVGPTLNSRNELMSKKESALERIAAAERYERKLSMANNSYERMLIHEECERLLGNSSPRALISRGQTDVRRIERDLMKLDERIEELERRASLEIHRVILDGNNLCYEHRTFLGLAILRPLVAELARSYAVTVVFDTSILNLLRCTESQLRRQFISRVDVHVVPDGIADETITALADEATSFIMSNDRFPEFRHRAAVSGNRLIRHQIVGGRVLIHDLSVDLSIMPAE